MDIITSLTEYPNQKHTIVLENNNSADMILLYNARMQAWFINLSFEDFEVNGIKVVLTPNLLRQFRYKLPFGLAIYAEDFVEPFEIEAFYSGRVKIGILNSEEVDEVETEIYNND